MSNILPKKKTNLSDQAYETIRNMIVSGELKQGEVISITALAAALEISRTPVTNACQRLEYDKFLTVIPKQGVVINTISIEDAREIYELRAAIEFYSAKRSFENFNNDDVDFLKECLQRQKDFAATNDIHNFMKEDTLFHKYILGKYNNTQFFTLLDNLFDRAFILGIKSSESAERLQGAISEHEKIIEALETGNKSEFVDNIEFNILSGFQNLTGRYEIK